MNCSVTLSYVKFQNELDEIQSVWNNHKIRTSRRGLPSGRPNIMFNVPVVYGEQSHLTNITQQEIDACRSNCSFRSAIPCDTDMYELCTQIMRRDGHAFPKTTDEGLGLYMSLRDAVRQLLNL